MSVQVADVSAAAVTGVTVVRTDAAAVVIDDVLADVGDGHDRGGAFHFTDFPRRRSAGAVDLNHQASGLCVAVMNHVVGVEPISAIPPVPFDAGTEIRRQIGAGVDRRHENIVRIGLLFIKHAEKAGVIVMPFAAAGGKSLSFGRYDITVVLVHVKRNLCSLLFEIVDAGDVFCAVARLIQCRQQHRGENCDDHYSIDIKLMSIGKYATYI